MQLCISQVSTLTTPLEQELQAYARGGWSFMEIWLPKLETYLEQHTLDDYRSLLEANEIVPIAAASQGGLLIARDQQKASIESQYRKRLSLLAELGVKVLTLTPDFHHHPKDDDTRKSARKPCRGGADGGPARRQTRTRIPKDLPIHRQPRHRGGRRCRRPVRVAGNLPRLVPLLLWTKQDRRSWIPE